jgi:hypothetical protein
MKTRQAKLTFPGPQIRPGIAGQPVYARLNSDLILGAENQPSPIRLELLKHRSGTCPSLPGHHISKGHRMFKLLKYSALALTLVLGSTALAHARPYDGPQGWNYPPPPPIPSHTAPEVDPSLALSGFALLGGSLTVLRSRRRNR